MARHTTEGKAREEVPQRIDSTLANSIPTVARRLCVSERTVRRLVGEGHLTPVRVKRRTLVSAASLTRFVEEGGTH